MHDKNNYCALSVFGSVISNMRRVRLVQCVDKVKEI